MVFYYGTLFVSFFVIALIIRFYTHIFHDLAQHSLALVNELISDYEDDIKIKRIQKKTNKLLFSLLKVILLFIIALVLGGILIAVYCFIAHIGYHDLVFSSFYSILFISIGATIPFLIPFGKRKEKSSYSRLSQLLHRMALDNYRISEKLFKKETKKIKRKNLKIRKDFVIISGLARAGTTSLMNDLSKINDFVSLSYANMPFLMCPNIWAKFYKPKTGQEKERSHKDGIMIGLNSKEALEEYFFKVKADDSFINENYLSEYKILEEDYNDYLDYQTIIKLNDKKIYLAKNNNFILRYKSVREYNDDFLMVILYRDPIMHAASLMEKHIQYSTLQKEDAFVLEYMNWLGHHEFGLNQKPFFFNNSTDFIHEDKKSMDYWIKSWINYYRYVLTIKHPNTIFINYNSYCNNPNDVIKTITTRLDINSDIPEYKSFNNERKTDASVSTDLISEAQEIYNKLENYNLE